MKSRKYYLFEKTVHLTNPVATIHEDGTITGPRAKNMGKFLRAHGWPEVRPDLIFHWGFCWAEEVKENVNGKSQTAQNKAECSEQGLPGIGRRDHSLSYREMEINYIDMMGLSDEELSEFMKPEEIKEMREYLARRK